MRCLAPLLRTPPDQPSSLMTTNIPTAAMRTLGACALRVSPLALGHSMGQQSFDPEAAARFDRLIAAALDQGVNFFDTSDAYWDGLHEQWLARALGDRRGQAIIASKFGNITLPDGRKATNGEPAYVRACCEASLRRLRTDVIDLYYAHRIDPKVPIEDTVGEMSRLVAEGKVRLLGLCEASAATIRRAHAVHPITALQTELSLWYPDEWLKLRDLLEAMRISFVGYSPLGRGLLTGQIRGLDDLAPKDRRRIHPRFHDQHIGTNLALVDRMRPLAEALGLSTAQLALAWVTQLGHDVVPVTGTQSEAKLRQSIAASQYKLPPATVEALNMIFNPQSRAGTRYPEAMLPDLGV